MDGIPYIITKPFFCAREGVREVVLRNPTDAETRRRGSRAEDFYRAPQVKPLESKVWTKRLTQFQFPVSSKRWLDLSELELLESLTQRAGENNYFRFHDHSFLLASFYT